jgi:hypothetical protein
MNSKVTYIFRGFTILIMMICFWSSYEYEDKSERFLLMACFTGIINIILKLEDSDE